MIYKFYNLILVISIFASCTSVSPVQLVSTGKIKSTHLQCSNFFLGLGNSENIGLNYIIKETGIKKEDIVTIDEKFTHFLYPLFYQTCTIIGIKDSGIRKINKLNPTISFESNPFTIEENPKKRSDCKNLPKKRKNNCLKKLKRSKKGKSS